MDLYNFPYHLRAFLSNARERRATTNDSSSRRSRRRPGSTPPRPPANRQQNGRRAPNRFGACAYPLSCLSSATPRILLLRRSVTTSTAPRPLRAPLSSYRYHRYLSLSLPLSPFFFLCFSPPRRSCTFLLPATLLCTPPVALLRSFVSSLLSLSLSPSPPIYRRIRPLVFADIFSIVSLLTLAPLPHSPPPLLPLSLFLSLSLSTPALSLR